MGAGASSSPTDLIDRGGIIDLDDSRKQVIQTIDSLFQQLLRTTNPINIRQALETTGTCNGILVLLQPTIEKEFQRIAFEDPETKQIVQALFKGYDSIDDLSSSILTKILCKEISLFFLRLIILIGTCVISIRPNKALTGLLGTIGSSYSSAMGEKDYSGIMELKMEGPPAVPKVDASGRKPDEKAPTASKLFTPLLLDPKDDTLRSLIKKVLNKDPDSIVKKNVDDFYILLYDAKEYIFDSKNLVVYRNELDPAKKVGVISLTGSYTDPILPEVKKGGTRRQRRQRRSVTRRQRGGSGGSETAQYYYMFNRTTEACDRAKPVRISCEPSDEKTISTSNTATDFVNQVLKYYTSVFTGSGASKEKVDKFGAGIKPLSKSGTAPSGYGPLSLKEAGTYSRLQKLLETGTVGKLQEGTCLAVYRAYLLASGVITTDTGKLLKTYVCHDSWAEQSLSEIPMFALLDQLYKDRSGDEKEPETQMKYEAFIDRFNSVGTVELKEGGEKSIGNLKFKKIEKGSFCKDGLSGLDSITDVGIIENVMSEYRSITSQLEKLIEDITTVLNKIIDFQLFIQEKRITLRPVFFTDKRGAHAVLNEFIESIRTTLEEHILSVEQSYYNGTAFMKNMSHNSLLVDTKRNNNAVASSLLV